MLARLAAAHADSQRRLEVQKANWREIEAPAIERQMAALEENITLLEREMRTATAALNKAESEERSGGLSSSGTPADLELTLGALEDKLLFTTQELEDLRRQSYFPAVEGYQLRFSYKDTFVGLKELLLEQFSAAITLTVTPGIGKEGQAARVPTVVLRIAGPTPTVAATSCSSAGGGSRSCAGSNSPASGGGGGGGGGARYGASEEEGALLRFRGEGVSLVSRREMLGVALAPNVQLQRMDVSVRFAATIPLIYFPRRRAWRPEAGFKIELLPDRRAGGADPFGGAPEHLLRVLLQTIIEGLMKAVVHRQFGPHLGEYLRHAAEGCVVELELSLRGLPVRTYDGKLAAWASGKLEGSSAEERAVAAAAAAEGLVALGLSSAQACELAQAEGLISSLPVGCFGTMSSMLQYFQSAGLTHDQPRRAALASLWQQALAKRVEALPNATCGAPIDVLRLFERLAALKRKPVQMSLRFRRVRLGLTLERALAAGCSALAAQLARQGQVHSSARTLLESFREDCTNALRALSRHLVRASAVLSAALRGGPQGRLTSFVRDASFEGTWRLASLISPPVAKPYQLLVSVLPTGQLQILLSLSQPPKTTHTAPETTPVADPDADAVASAAAAAAGASEGAAGAPPPSPSSLHLLSLHVAQLSASVLAGDYEVLRLDLVQLDPRSSSREAPGPPELPPLPGAKAGEQPQLVVERREGTTGAVVGTTGAVVGTTGAVVGTSGAVVGTAGAARSTPSHSAVAEGADARAVVGYPAAPPILGKPAAPIRARKLVEVWENQRRLAAFRPYSAADLLPLDPGAWTDGHRRFAEIDLVPLPNMVPCTNMVTVPNEGALGSAAALSSPSSSSAAEQQAGARASTAAAKIAAGQLPVLMPWQRVGDTPLQLPTLPTIADMKLPQMPSIQLPHLPWQTSSSSDEQQQPPSPSRSVRRVQDGAWLTPTDTAPSPSRSVPSLAPVLGAAVGDGNGGRGAAAVASSSFIAPSSLSSNGGRLGPPKTARAGAPPAKGGGPSISASSIGASSIGASSIGAHPVKGGGGGGGGGGGVYGGGQGGLWRWVGEWRIDLDGEIDGASKSELGPTNPKSELGPTNPKSELGLTNPKSELGLTNPKSEDGWQFAWNWSTGWLASSNPLTHVRRRRWVRWAEFVHEAELGVNVKAELASWAVGKLEKGSAEGRAATATAATATAATAAAAPLPLLLSPSAAALLSERAAAVESLLQDQEEVSAEAAACAQDGAWVTPPIDATRSGRCAQDGAGVTPTDAAHSGSSRFASPLRPRASSPPPPPPPALAVAVPTSAMPAAPPLSQSLAPPERWGGDGDAATASGMAGAAAAASGTPWLGGGGAALLRMAVADGARVRLRAQHIELRARASLLFDHMSALLQEQLEVHPWYAEPLRVAAERARKHLGSERLRVHGALKIELSVDSAQDGARESHLVVEGVPRAMLGMPCATEEDEHEEDGPSSPSRATSSGVCATFEIDINLLDLVTDVQDIYRSFLANNHTLLDKMAKGGGVTAAK